MDIRPYGLPFLGLPLRRMAAPVRLGGDTAPLPPLAQQVFHQGPADFKQRRHFPPDSLRVDPLPPQSGSVNPPNKLSCPLSAPTPRLMQVQIALAGRGELAAAVCHAACPRATAGRAS
jgi:hypothetical protein